MDGLYLDNKKIEANIQKWMDSISSSGEWSRIDMHINEIDGFENITRSEWISASFSVLNIISTRMNLSDSLRLFLHIDLNDFSNLLHLDVLSLNWLEDNLNKYTPPNFCFTSLEYYNEFYKKELISCNPNLDILELIHPSVKFDFFYRTYFDENERMYSGEIYVFL